MLTTPPGEQEVARARDFALGQPMGLFDGPATMADRIALDVSFDRSPSSLFDLPPLVRDLTVPDVRKAAEKLFGDNPFTVAVCSDLDPAVFG